MHKLPRQDRLQLLRFVCSFAWADLEIAPEERAFIEALATRHAMDEDELREVHHWLRTPPRPEDVDPLDIPLEHKRIFLDSARGLIRADGVVSAREEETFRLFKDLLK